MVNDKPKVYENIAAVSCKGCCTVSIGKDAGVTETLSYICADKTCKNVYLNCREPSDSKICDDCGKEMERLTEKHLEPRPGELEALRKKHGLSKKQMKAKGEVKEIIERLFERNAINSYGYNAFTRFVNHIEELEKRIEKLEPKQ